MQKDLFALLSNNNMEPAREESVSGEIAHLNIRECQLLDDLQGGEKRVPELGNIRSYMDLESLFANPEYQQMIDSLVADFEHEADNDDLVHQHEETSELADEMLPVPNMHERHESAEMTTLAEHGTNGDTEVALCPSNMLDTFDRIRGFTSRNPVDGLRQYGWNKIGKFFKKAARVVGTVVGAIYGGPAGAAVASAVGSKLLGKDKSWRAAGINAAKGAAAAWGANKLGATAALRNAGQAAAQHGGLAGLQHLANSTVSGIQNLSGNLTQLVPSALTGGNAGQGALSQGATQGATNQTGFFSNLMRPSILLPTALMAGSMYMANRDSRKRENEYLRKEEENEQRNRAYSKGIFDVMHSSGPYMRSPQYETSFENDPDLDKFGYEQSYRKLGAYATGGRVESHEDHSSRIVGKGKGQDDKVMDDYKAGDWVIRADAVSNLGDGSSNGGYDELDKLIHYIKNAKGDGHRFVEHSDHHQEHLDKNVPVAVSDGEYRVDRYNVLAAGDGNPAKASKIFQLMTDMIAKDKKKTLKNGMPPKAKSAISYFKQAEKLVNKKR